MGGARFPSAHIYSHVPEDRHHDPYEDLNLVPSRSRPQRVRGRSARPRPRHGRVQARAREDDGDIRGHAARPLLSSLRRDPARRQHRDDHRDPSRQNDERRVELRLR